MMTNKTILYDTGSLLTAHDMIDDLTNDISKKPNALNQQLKNQPLSSWILSPAKLNLFLHITGKRADGYHNLQTLFRLVNWGDAMRFEPLADSFLLTEIQFTNTQFCQNDTHQATDNKANNWQPHRCPIQLSGGDDITTSLADNLIYKAAYALLDYVTDNHPNCLSQSFSVVHITIDKHIPMGAGLGGGSSNAATTLLMLNHIWQLGLSNTQLQSIGRTLGADVPIFVFGQDAYATGIGDVFEPVQLPNQHYLLLLPQTHIATANLFAHCKLQRDKTELSMKQLLACQNDYLFQLNPPFGNVFEPVVRQLSQPVAVALDYLDDICQTHGLSATPRLTGSGACVFLPLADTDHHDAITQKWQQNAPCQALLVQSLNAIG